MNNNLYIWAAVYKSELFYARKLHSICRLHSIRTINVTFFLCSAHSHYSLFLRPNLAVHSDMDHFLFITTAQNERKRQKQNQASQRTCISRGYGVCICIALLGSSYVWLIFWIAINTCTSNTRKFYYMMFLLLPVFRTTNVDVYIIYACRRSHRKSMNSLNEFGWLPMNTREKCNKH